jgi:trigger factor
MQITVEEISPVTKKISVEIPSDQVEAAIDKVYAEIRKKAKYEGFRPGKIPMHIVKRVYREAMLEQVQHDLYKKSFIESLQKNDINPLDTPLVEFSPVVEGSPFKYTAEVEVAPKIDLKDYLSIPVNKEKCRPSTEAIENELRVMQNNLAQLIPVDDDVAVEIGHEVTVDYSLSIEGLPDEGKRELDVVIVAGDDSIAPGFDKQLIGMKIGDEKEIKVTIPEGGSNPETAGKEGVYQIRLKEIKRKELPELDDEFAQQIGDYETMDELRESMLEYFEKSENDRVEDALNDNLVNALIESNPLEVPKSFVKSQLDYMIQSFKKQLQKSRIPFEKFGMSDDALRERFHDEAVGKVKGQLLLMALMEKENINVSDEDVENRFEKVADGDADRLARIRDYYSSNREAMDSLKSEIRTEKAFRFLQDNAVITEIEPAEAEAA